MSDLRQLAQAIRIKSLEMVHRANASHIGSALSIVDILAVLYGKVLNYRKLDPLHPQRDRFILSKGHACVAVYAALSEIGFISPEELLTYGQDFSWLMNHISHKVPGVEFSTGSLGHGLPFALGKAMAAKQQQESWRSYVLLGDGEMDEGSNWEALMFAAHHKISNLIAIIDCNNLQSLTTTSLTLSLEPLPEKLISFGCDVKEVDGHDYGQLIKALTDCHIDKPRVVIAKTIKGKGVSFMENKVEWHYKSPSDSELSMALSELKGA